MTVKITIPESTFWTLLPKVKTEIRTLIKGCVNKTQLRVFQLCGKYDHPEKQATIDIEELCQGLTSQAIDQVKQLIQWRKDAILTPKPNTKSKKKLGKSSTQIQEAQQKWVPLDLLVVAKNNANNPRFKWSGWWKVKKSARRIGR